jgi:uncharacterized protein YggE
MQRRPLVVAAFIVLARSASAQLTTADASHPEVTASGRGIVQLTPTRAGLSVTIVTRAGSAEEAAAQNTRLVSNTRGALRNAGLSDAEIRRVAYNVGQNSDDRGKPDGFVARYTLRIETSQLDNIGRIVDAALSGGANEISSVQFFAPNSDDQRREAIRLAVAAARSDADVIAKAAGGALGRLISITSFSSGGPPEFYMQGAVVTAGGSARAPTYIPPNDLTIAAQASGRWEFIPNR